MEWTYARSLLVASGVLFVLAALGGFSTSVSDSLNTNLSVHIAGNWVWLYGVLGVASLAVGFLVSDRDAVRMITMWTGVVYVVAALASFFAPASWNVGTGDIVVGIVIGAALAIAGFVTEREATRQTGGRPAM